MSAVPFKKGLHDFGNGCYAWLVPDGSWGYSNAGLIESDGESLLVDTLYDLPSTREMLASMRASVPAAREIGTLVNTHSNGDHTYGNQLLSGSRIIASQACAEEMAARPPERFLGMLRNWREMGELGEFLHEMFSQRFDYEGIVFTPPTRTFERELTLTVGSKTVQLLNVGPAHTRGDVLVHVPEDRTVFTGDVLFVDVHPAVWDGSVANWIKACDLILGWDVETVVPGHGRVTDKQGVRHFKDYLEYLRDETRRRFDAGMDVEEAARDIAFDPFRHWLDEERAAANVLALYREFSGSREPPDVTRALTMMARRHHEKKRAGQACAVCDEVDKP